MKIDFDCEGDRVDKGGPTREFVMQSPKETCGETSRWRRSKTAGVGVCSERVRLRLISSVRGMDKIKEDQTCVNW